MKVMKFGGTSVGSPQRIKDVAALVNSKEGNIVVLSAMSGTTNQLLEIADYLQMGNPVGAAETLSRLEDKYSGVISELFADAEEEYRCGATKAISLSIEAIRSEIEKPMSGQTEKNIVSRGELMSTALMLNYMLSQGINAKMLPALDYMVIDASGEPIASTIAERLKKLKKETGEADLYITQGFI